MVGYSGRDSQRSFVRRTGPVGILRSSGPRRSHPGTFDATLDQLDGLEAGNVTVEVAG